VQYVTCTLYAFDAILLGATRGGSNVSDEQSAERVEPERTGDRGAPPSPEGIGGFWAVTLPDGTYSYGVAPNVAEAQEQINLRSGRASRRGR
jgi:hypothetical protein